MTLKLLTGIWLENIVLLPNIEDNTCMVVSLGYAGHIQKALFVIRMMPSSNCPAICFALLGACRNLINVNLGKFVFYRAE